MPRKLQNEVEWIMNVWSIASQMLNCSKTGICIEQKSSCRQFHTASKATTFCLFWSEHKWDAVFFSLYFSIEMILLQHTIRPPLTYTFFVWNKFRTILVGWMALVQQKQNVPFNFSKEVLRLLSKQRVDHLHKWRICSKNLTKKRYAPSWWCIILLGKFHFSIVYFFNDDDNDYQQEGKRMRKTNNSDWSEKRMEKDQ